VGWLLTLAATGCRPDLPSIEYETEHLRIGTDLDHPLCHGDLVAFERIISRVEDELGLEMGGVATVYIWDYQRWRPEDVGCPEYSLGCFDIKNMTVLTSPLALEHELVHAVIGEIRPAPFFEEGLAEVYGGAQTVFGLTAPSANEGTTAETADLSTGRHFVRWLRERWGPGPLGQLVRTNDRTFASFETIYGMPLEEIEVLYFEDAPYGYPPVYGCDGLELTEEPDGRGWRSDITLDCSLGEDTRAAGVGMKVHRTFYVSEPGYYTISADADWFDIFRCSEARIEQPASPLAHLEDAPVHHASYPSGASRHYFGRGIRNLYLDVGVHDIALGLLGHEQGTAQIEISSALGPQPAK
jgi:hypothetical protein